MMFAVLQYGGYDRWQLWFDNPNKAALLFVEVVVVGLTAAICARKNWAAIGVCVAVAATFAMVHTFSRGGVVAFLAAFLLMLPSFRQCKVPRRRMLLVAIVLCVLCVAMWSMGLFHRLVFGLSGLDASVENRYALWRAVPQMMVGAPWGWGIGQAGGVFEDWYQPLNRIEHYRTLVNSHLTWVVEFGILGSAAYVGFWVGILTMSHVIGHRTGHWSCFAAWSALFVAGCFSSVCEAWSLWIIPFGLLLLERKSIVHIGHQAFLLVLKLSLGSSVLFVIAFVSMMFILRQSSVVHNHGSWIGVGGGYPRFWLLPDEDVLGGAHYPREARALLSSCSFAIAKTACAIPQDADVVVVCGAAEDLGKRGRLMTIWVSPIERNLVGSETNRIVVGSFTENAEKYKSMPGAVEIDGAMNYIPNWTTIIKDMILDKNCKMTKTRNMED